MTTDRTVSRHARWMSLKLRLLLIVTCIMGTGLTMGGGVMVYVGQRAVETEVYSAVQMTRLLISGMLEAPESYRDGLLPVLEQSLAVLRHVRVDIEGRDVIETGHRIESVPAWFVRLLTPRDLAGEKAVITGVGGRPDIVIHPDPRHEILEIWHDFKIMLVGFLSTLALTCVLVYLGLLRGLAPLRTLQGGIRELEAGHYDVRIDTDGVPELASIQSGFNLMAESLRTSIRDREMLAARAVALQEDERRSVARELHDELAPYLFRIRADATVLQQINRQADSPTAKFDHVLDELQESVVHLQGRVRALYGRLRPQLLEDHDLREALEALVASWRCREPEMDWLLSVDGDLADLDDAVRVATYRLVQEALTNAARHACAESVRVSVRRERSAERIELEVRDDGRGITPDWGPGLGIIGMRERVEALGGRFVWEPGAEGGMIVQASVPAKPVAEH